MQSYDQLYSESGQGQLDGATNFTRSMDGITPFMHSLKATLQDLKISLN